MVPSIASKYGRRLSCYEAEDAVARKRSSARLEFERDNIDGPDRIQRALVDYVE